MEQDPPIAGAYSGFQLRGGCTTCACVNRMAQSQEGEKHGERVSSFALGERLREGSAPSRFLNFIIRNVASKAWIMGREKGRAFLSPPKRHKMSFVECFEHRRPCLRVLLSLGVRAGLAPFYTLLHRIIGQ